VGKRASSTVEPVIPPVHVIDPKAVYTIPQARHALGLARGTLPRESRLGRLRVARRAGKHYVLGAWLLEWLEAGEVRREPRPVTTEAKPTI
jgi:hypothetical protein